jgi:Flp pilus assembly protein CpaB
MRSPLPLLWLLTGCTEHTTAPAPAPAPPVPVVVAAAPRPPVLPRGTTRVVVPLHGAASLQPGDHVDVLSVRRDRAMREPRAALVLQDVQVAGVGPPSSPRDVSLAVRQEDAPGVTLAALEGALHVALRGPGDDSVDPEQGETTRAALLGERPNTLRQKHRIRLDQASDGGALLTPPRGFRAFAFPFAQADAVTAGDHLDVTGVLPGVTGATVARLLLQDLQVLEAAEGGGSERERELTLRVLPDEATLLLLAAELGSLKLTLRHPDARDLVDDDVPVTPGSVRDGEQERQLQRLRNPGHGPLKHPVGTP